MKVKHPRDYRLIFLTYVVLLPSRGSDNYTGEPDKNRESLEKDNSFILTGILIDKKYVYLTETSLQASQNLKLGLVK